MNMLFPFYLEPQLLHKIWQPPKTSYTGAIMLEPEIDITFGGYEALDGNTQDAYAYFNGNSCTLVIKMMRATE